jgi:hypothetical protein
MAPPTAVKAIVRPTTSSMAAPVHSGASPTSLHEARLGRLAGPEVESDDAQVHDRAGLHARRACAFMRKAAVRVKLPRIPWTNRRSPTPTMACADPLERR